MTAKFNRLYFIDYPNIDYDEAIEIILKNNPTYIINNHALIYDQEHNDQMIIIDYDIKPETDNIDTDDKIENIAKQWVDNTSDGDAVDDIGRWMYNKMVKTFMEGYKQGNSDRIMSKDDIKTLFNDGFLYGYHILKNKPNFNLMNETELNNEFENYYNNVYLLNRS